MTVKEYKKYKKITESLKHITSVPNTTLEISGHIADMYRKIASRYASNTKDAKVYSLGKIDDVYHILVIANLESLVTINGMVNSSVASSEENRDAVIYIANNDMINDVYDIYNLIIDIFGGNTGQLFNTSIFDSMTIAYMVLTTFSGLYTEEQFKSIMHYAASISFPYVACESSKKHLIALEYAMEELLSYHNIYAFTPNILSITNSIEAGCLKANDDIWMRKPSEISDALRIEYNPVKSYKLKFTPDKTE